MTCISRTLDILIVMPNVCADSSLRSSIWRLLMRYTFLVDIDL